MGDFFHGWRRKIGVLTLVMACVIMGGWVRSQTIVDIFVLITGQKSALYLTSNESALALSQHSNIADPGPFPVKFYKWQSFPLHDKEYDLPRDSPSISWDYMHWGFGFGQAEMYTDGSPGAIRLVPYWSVVIPLTLLSALLLLSKPREKTASPTTVSLS